MKRTFQQVDVFGSEGLSGNPLAVVVGADGLSDAQMQRFARWMNLSETAFVMAPTIAEADYRVRIFTLARELPFAGHPTLGACHAWLTTGGSPQDTETVVQECGAGLIKVRRADGRLAFAAPPLRRDGAVDDSYLKRVTTVLGAAPDKVVDAQWADNGPGWVAVLLPDAGAVLALDPDSGPFRGDLSLDIGVVGPYPDGSPHAFEVRAFFTDERGILREDPVTGSLNASLGQWLLSTGRATAPYTARQGTRLGRAGQVVVDRDDGGTVWVGGSTTTVVMGTVTL